MAPQPADSTTNGLPADLWALFLEGDRRACARLITLVENEPERAPSLRDALSPRLGHAVRIGVTGPPGVGKSTLTASLAKRLAEEGHRVGVIAVDPSSPFTGGAFMGDRVRMGALVGDPRVFVRSMASREGHGGLSPATPDVADVLEGFGMDRILIETVGVGQAEMDVLACTDLVTLVLQPGTGDTIQTMKAGILEAADLVVVNKSDLPGADALLQSLRFVYGLGSKVLYQSPTHPEEPRQPATADRAVPPIVATSARRSEGIEEMAGTLEGLCRDLVESGRHAKARRDRMERLIRSAIERRLWTAYDELTGASAEIARKADELTAAKASPYPTIRAALDAVELRLKPPEERP